MAYELPLVFLQLSYDAELAASKDADETPTWRKPGEKAVDARDRLREERERNKRRLGVA